MGRDGVAEKDEGKMIGGVWHVEVTGFVADFKRITDCVAQLSGISWQLRIFVGVTGYSRVLV